MEDIHNINTLNDISALNDEAIIGLVKEGNEAAQEYILNKYKSVVKSKARAYFLIGADREDIIQEGMIGLYKAVRDFQPDRHASFRGFADLCINRQMITAVKTATRQKHMPLNSYVSLNKQIFDDETVHTYMDMLKEGDNSNPESMIISRENLNYIESNLSKILSSLELKVLSLYLTGKTYSEIAQILGKPEKSIDNALQRVKKKIEKFLEKKY